MKEEIFSKFKDYNKELEKILETKDFSKDTKNLLLSMFYKLEISYNDYYTVKRICKSKQEYLENILDNVKNSNKIELIQPKDEEFNEFKEKDIVYDTNLKKKSIKVIANEIYLLSSILELNNFQIYLKEEYNLIRNSIPYLLNKAYEMENVEVLRDFNAWSWNTLISNIKKININLVYQSLKIILDFDLFKKIQEGYEEDVIEIIKNQLYNKYSKDATNELLKLIYKISILIYIDISKNEEKRLLEEKDTIYNDLNSINDTKTYIGNITKEKKKLTEELKQIDLIINNKDKLLDEYKKRNSELSEYNKIFSISHLVEKMQKERSKIIEKIEICNKKLDPKEYVKDKEKLEKDYELLNDILDYNKKTDIFYYINKLEKLILKELLPNELEQVESKEEIIDFMYKLRYYVFLPYDEKLLIKDIEYFKNDIYKIKENTVKKMYKAKILNNISTNEINDIKIVSNIFDLKIINMEYIYIQIKKIENEQYIIKMYDEKETLEKEIKMNLVFNKKDKIKLNKKIKLFI